MTPAYVIRDDTVILPAIREHLPDYNKYYSYVVTEIVQRAISFTRFVIFGTTRFAFRQARAWPQIGYCL